MAENLKNLTTLIKFVKNYFSSVVLKIKGKVEITNLPKVQKVVVENPTQSHKAVEVTNLSELRKSMEASQKEVVSVINQQTKVNAPEKLKKDLVSQLKQIKEVLSSDKDYEPFIRKQVDGVVKAVNSIELTVDFKDVLMRLDGVMAGLKFFENVKRHDEIKVRLPDKQVKELAQASTSAIVSGGGIPDDKPVIVAKRRDSGTSDSADEERDKQYTAVYNTPTGDPEVGQRVHVIGDGDKYVVSNITEGSAITGKDAIPIAGEDSSGNKQHIRLDDSTLAVTTIDYEHHEIHGGSHYFVQGFLDIPGANDVLDFTWLMPNTEKWIHWTWEIDTEKALEWYVYENVVANNPLANTMTPINSNRNSDNTSGTTLKYEIQVDLAAANVDTDVTSPAILVASGSVGDNKTAGAAARSHEMILDQGKLYCLRAVASAAGYINFKMEWYEHTDKV